MAQHARIEEVSDSSSASDSDPDVMDIDAIVPSTRSQSLMDPSQIPSSASQIPQHSAPQFDPSTAKKWICLYPLYFDATRSHKQGRRVGKEYAVENPLAKTMVDAVASFGLKVFFEPGKTHPKDWSNPGRARVELKDEGGKQKRNTVNNKAHLYIHVGKYLKAHPTTINTPMEFPIRGMPMPDEPPGPPATPRGWKMGTILPLHSAAVSGGGVSEDLLKDMMSQMGGGGPALPSAPTPAAIKQKEKKEKKKGK